MLAMKVDMPNFDQKMRQFAETPALIQKAVVGALSETVDDLIARQQREMKQTFNNPTPYILKGIKGAYPGGGGPVRGFRKGRTGVNVTQAGTYFEFFPVGQSPEDIVKPHVFGGSRQQKRSERRLAGLGLLPGNGFSVMGSEYPKNSSGDISGARYTQMLHQLGGLSDMARQSMPKNRQKNRGGTSYFVIRRGGRPIAIAERNGSNTRIMLVFARNVQYQKRYQYFEVGEKQVAYSLPTHFNRILQRYMSRM